MLSRETGDVTMLYSALLIVRLLNIKNFSIIGIITAWNGKISMSKIKQM